MDFFGGVGEVWSRTFKLVLLFCLHACLCTMCIPGACGDLESQTVVKQHVNAGS